MQSVKEPSSLLKVLLLHMSLKTEATIRNYSRNCQPGWVTKEHKDLKQNLLYSISHGSFRHSSVHCVVILGSTNGMVDYYNPCYLCKLQSLLPSGETSESIKL